MSIVDVDSALACFDNRYKSKPIIPNSIILLDFFFLLDFLFLIAIIIIIYKFSYFVTLILIISIPTVIADVGMDVVLTDAPIFSDAVGIFVWVANKTPFR